MMCVLIYDMFCIDLKLCLCKHVIRTCLCAHDVVQFIFLKMLNYDYYDAEMQ